MEWKFGQGSRKRASNLTQTGNETLKSNLLSKWTANGGENAEAAKDKLDKDIIEPVASECARNFLFISKCDGSMRFCVDDLRISEARLLDKYTIPRIGGCIDSLGDAVVFLSLDVNCEYWKILIAKENIEKT